MEYPALIQELAKVLGISLEFSESGTCGVLFDQDEILFEIHENRLFIMADLGPSEGREDAAMRLLTAANLGMETGFACAGIDEARGEFTLCRILEGDLAYADFEKILTLFVSVVRYWKKWIALPKQESAEGNSSVPNLNANSVRV